MSTTLSCGECGAPLRAEQDWCSLCYATVAPSFDPLTAPLDEVVSRDVEPETVPAPEPPASAYEPESDQLVIAVAELAPAPDPEPSTKPIEVSELDVMFSMLAAEHRRSDPAAGIADRLTDRSTRIAVMVGGTALIGAAVFLVLTVLGALV